MDAMQSEVEPLVLPEDPPMPPSSLRRLGATAGGVLLSMALLAGMVVFLKSHGTGNALDVSAATGLDSTVAGKGSSATSSLDSEQWISSVDVGSALDIGSTQQSNFASEEAASDQYAESALSASQSTMPLTASAGQSGNAMLDKINGMLKEKVLPGLNAEFPKGIKEQGKDPMQLPPSKDATSAVALKQLEGLSELQFDSFVATGFNPPGSDGLAVIPMTLTGKWTKDLIMTGTMTIPPKRRRRLGFIGGLIKDAMKRPTGPVPMTVKLSDAKLRTTSIQAFINPADKTITKFEMPDLAVTIAKATAAVQAGMLSGAIDGKVNGQMDELKTKMEALLSQNFETALLKAFQAKLPMSLAN